MGSASDPRRPDSPEKAHRSPSRKVRLIAYLLFSALLLSLSILAVVLSVRIQDFWHSDYRTMASLFQIDRSREGGHLIPDMDVLAHGERSNRPVRWVTNSKGFRSEREFTYDVPAHTFRVLLIGDSYVDGLRTDQEQTIGFGLETRLAKAACPAGVRDFEVLISGQFNPAAAAYHFQEHGRKYDPDLVILGITVGNDITPGDYKKSIWPKRDDPEDPLVELVLADRPADQNDWRGLYLPADAYLQMGSLRRFYLEREKDVRQRLADFVPGMGQLGPPSIGAPRPNKRHRVHAGANLTSLGLFYDPLLPEVEEWFRHLDEVLLVLNGRVLSTGGKLLVVIFPTRAQVDARDWRALEKFYSLDGTKFRLDYPGRRIQQLCRDHQLDCLDLLPGMRAHVEQTGARLYMERGDMHFNVAGQALASELMAHHICGPRPLAD
jgi:hypothetical protein